MHGFIGGHRVKDPEGLLIDGGCVYMVVAFCGGLDICHAPHPTPTQNAGSKEVFHQDSETGEGVFTPPSPFLKTW